VTGHGITVLSAAVPRPTGFAWLAQEISAAGYRGSAVTLVASSGRRTPPAAPGCSCG
jgi:hypothetical protein